MGNTERKYKKIVVENLYFVKQLDNLGFCRKYIGFYMIIEIMNLLINKNMRVSSFSKQVYPIVAQRCNTTCCTIERNIRSFIKKSWCKNLMDIFQKYYPLGQTPTCRDFIYMIKNYITKQMV